MALRCSVKDEGLPSSHPWPFSFVLLISPSPHLPLYPQPIILPELTQQQKHGLRGRVRKWCVCVCVLCLKHMSHPSFFPTKVKVFEVNVYIVGLPQAQFLFFAKGNSVF